MNSHFVTVRGGGGGGDNFRGVQIKRDTTMVGLASHTNSYNGVNASITFLYSWLQELLHWVP